MTTSTAASESWVVGRLKAPADSEPMPVALSAGGIRRHFRTLAVLLEDALILLLVVWLFSVIVLVLGAPVALLAELVSRLIKLF